MRQEILDLAAQHNVTIDARPWLGWDYSMLRDNNRIIVGEAPVTDHYVKKMMDGARHTGGLIEFVVLHELGHAVDDDIDAATYNLCSTREKLDAEAAAWNWAIKQRGGMSRLTKSQRKLVVAAMRSYQRDFGKGVSEPFDALLDKVEASL